ncbi:MULTISPECIES: alkaline phosphatase D family protein [Micromonospora]|uniref:alkaline phosphatase D family protein n=1 Tax=Micromonospora TaxID=1873 RepID=UPI001EE8984A|nr:MULTISPECIES: alkaline phosphatase D family protein [Micromonospora]MCG5452119.1 alkaline phosphatase D family protein [Micromonospora hortensis]MCX5117748.1 alkaline phosphatase D family protein [Micromonospora sp. NBC_00362]
MTRLSRRIFVLSGLVTAGVAVTPRQGARAAVPYPFKLGVASGDPAPDSVVLWTRLAPSPLNADGQGGMANADVTVEWQVSTTDRFTSLVSSGSVVARYADAHSVHAIAGGLAADSDYYYRFRAQGQISPVGRTRTAPAPSAFGRDLVMAFASCAHYEAGYYTAYRRMAEDNPGLILHLGDYIYEGGVGSSTVRQHVGAEIVSLADYRRRYALYKSDPDLQAAHAAAPWLVVPDDHEVENNYATMVRNDSSPTLTAAQWTARRTAAYRAYYENMPLRPASAANGNSIPLYRRIRWGQLATFHMLDTRQFRDDQACGDGWKVCADADLASRSLTGATQEAWLLDGLAQRYGTWDILGQQVFFAQQLDANGAASMDAWDGYRASRSRIQTGWQQRGVRNPLVLTGDVHRSWANNLKADYANPSSATVGTELVCTSISSTGNGSGSTTVPNAAANPHLKFYSDRRGYVRTTISRSQVRADFRAVNSVTEHGAAASTVRSFVILDGQPGLQAG